MVRGEYAWINVNDEKNAIGIWIKKELIKDILYTGSYKAKGDLVETRPSAASRQACAIVRHQDRESPPWPPGRMARPPACSARGGAPCAARRQTHRAGRHMRGVLAQAVPGHERRREIPLGEHPITGDAHGQDGRLRVLGEQQLILRAVEAQPAEILPQSRVGLGHCVARHRKGLGERLAHPDLLRSLPRKDECNHDEVPCSVWSSCSIRPTSPSAANRCAMRMALRTAFTDERPWPTMHAPATPSSGAPPYSE